MPTIAPNCSVCGRFMRQYPTYTWRCTSCGNRETA